MRVVSITGNKLAVPARAWRTVDENMARLEEIDPTLVQELYNAGIFSERIWSSPGQACRYMPWLKAPS